MDRPHGHSMYVDTFRVLVHDPGFGAKKYNASYFDNVR